MRMRLIIKNTLKNIKASKGRTFLMVALIVFAAYTAMLALDMSKTIVSLNSNLGMYRWGTTDLLIRGNFDPEYLEKLPKNEVLEIFTANDTKYVMDPDSYQSVIEVPVTVTAYSDEELATEMKRIRETFNLKDDEVVVTSMLAKVLDIEEGSTLELTSVTDKTYEFTIKKIYKSTADAEFCVYTNPDVIMKLNSVPYNDPKNSAFCIDIKDDNLVKTTYEEIRSEFPLCNIENIHDITGGDSESASNVFYLVFLLAILLVGFVSVSTSEKIVIERMSTIGTLRSLGVSNNKTAFILILENFAYSLIGSVVGGVLYGISKKPILSTLFFAVDDDGAFFDAREYITETPLYAYVLMFVLITILVCAYPAIELLKAVKTPIRDIIFNNKDTKYKYRKITAYIAGVLFLLALVTALMNKSFIGLCISLISIVVSLALIVPFLILVAGKLVEKLASMRGKVLLKFAARNMYNNKNIVGTSVLVVTSMLLALLIVNFTVSQYKSIAYLKYDADVTLFKPMNVEETVFLNNIPEIKSYELMRYTNSYTSINGEESKFFSVESQADYTMYHTQEVIDHKLAANEVAIASIIAKQYNLKVGDEFVITFNSDEFFPITRKLTVGDIIPRGSYSENSSPVMVINPDLYDYLFGDTISEVLISCDNPEEVKSILYAAVPGTYVSTRVDEMRSIAQQTSSFKNAAMFLVLGVSGLTFIGIAGNHTMGFEARRREFAVLYSTAMPKRKIYKMLYIESIMSIVIATVATWIGTPLLTRVFNEVVLIVTDYDMPPVSMNISSCLMYTAIMIAIFALSTRVPVKRIRKMNTTQELKYE